MSTQLTALLGAPSQKNWHAICRLLEAWPDGPDRDAALQAADRGLSAWPEKGLSMLSGWPTPNRAAPAAWCRKLLKGVVPRGWALVRFLQYHATTVSPRQLQNILGCGQLSQLTHLYLGWSGLQSPLAATLAAHADQLASLEALSLSGNNLAGDRLDGFTAQLAGQLHYLNLENCTLTDAEVAPLLSASLPRLRYLSLGGSLLSDDTLDALMASDGLPALQVLQLTTRHPRHTARLRVSTDRVMWGPGRPHLRRAVWAGERRQERPAMLRQRCRDAGIRGHSKLSKHGLIEILLEKEWDHKHGPR